MAKLDKFIIDNTTYELVPEIAPLFNPATPYYADDCVIHDAVLYKFTANHTGAWTGNDVVAFEVGKELASSIRAGEILRNYLKNNEVDMLWVRGALSSSTGGTTNSNANKRCRTSTWPLANQIVVADISTRFTVYFYNGGDSSNNYLGKTDWMTLCKVSEYAAMHFPTADRFKLLGSNADDSMIGDGESADVSSVTDYIYVCSSIPKILESIAPIFTRNTSYSVGDCVFYSDRLYKFTANHAAGAWTVNDVASTSVADEIKSFALSTFSFTLGTHVAQIPSGDDLNNYTAPGNYRAVSDAIVASLSNCPTTTGFRLMVLATTTTSNISQVLIDRHNIVYVRSSPSSGTWTRWRRSYSALTPTGSDDTSAILTELNRYGQAFLLEGTYYVNGLVMPANSRIIGSGNKTILVDSSDTNSCVKLVNGCSISDLKIVGNNGESWTATGTIGTSHGIIVNAGGDSDSNRNRINISNIEVCGFSGGGICLTDTGTNYENSVNAVNAYVHNNNVGIYIPHSSEYNRFTNIQSGRNYYGCVNNGANNVFSNCGFNGNVQGLLMDNSDNLATNNAHGSFVGCTFNHSGNNSGKAIEIINMTSGEVFSACQIFYGTIHLTSSKGVLFSGCNFGSDSGIYASGGANLMVGCVQLSRANTPITLSNNAIFHAVNCYSREGTLYTDFP